MNKINNKSIVLGLGILAILSFGVAVMPTIASAAYGTNITYQTTSYDGYYVNNPKPSIDSINPSSSNLGVGTKTVTISGNSFVPGSVARINGVNRPVTFIDSSHLLVQITGDDIYAYRTNGGFFISVFNGAPGGGYSNAAFFTVNNGGVSNNNVTNTNNNGYTNTANSNFVDTGAGTNNTGNNTGNTSTNYSDLASNAIYGSNSFAPSGIVQWVFFGIIILIIVILVRKIFGAEKRYHETPLKHD